MSSEKRSSPISPPTVRVTSRNLIQSLDLFPEALLVVNQAGIIVMTNEQMGVLFACARQDIVGQPLETLLPQRFQSIHRSHRKRYFMAPQMRPMGGGFQLFGIRKNGTEFPVDVSLKPLLVDERLHVIGTVRDLTQQKRLDEEGAIRTAEGQSLSTMNMILAATSEFVYLIDKDGRYRFASERGAALLGLQQRDYLGKTWQELGLSAEFIEPFEVKRQQVMSTGQVITDEFPFPVALGMRWFEYIIHPILDRQGEVTSVVVSSRDVTEHKQALDIQYRLASIVESSGSAIFSKTLEGVITSWNQAAEQLFGYAANEIIGHPVSLLFPAHLQHDHLDFMAHIKRGEILKDHETTRVRKDGTLIEVATTVSPILDHHGQLVGASSIAFDITERKRLVQELTALNAELQQANQARGQFLATMSHELRTPLASIIGFSEMLLEDIKDSDGTQQQENLQRILNNSEHLLALINDVLDLSKIEAGRMPLDYHQVNVPQVLSSVTQEIQSLAITRHLVLKTETQEGVTTLETDPRKLHQILLNLLSNALKFTERGTVLLCTTRVLFADQKTPGIAFAVKDTGIGIPLTIQEHIFEPFYQADMSYTRKVGGTGLGLSIVGQLTALLGGTITIESAPGQGSTFTVTLPIKAASPWVEHDLPRLHPGPHGNVLTTSACVDAFEPTPSPEVAEHEEAVDEQRHLILAVDDNPDAFAFLKHAL